MACPACCSPCAVKTHRELFADFFASLFGYPLEDLIAKGAPDSGAQAMWAAMSRDIMTGGGKYSDAMSQVRSDSGLEGRGLQGVGKGSEKCKGRLVGCVGLRCLVTSWPVAASTPTPCLRCG